MTKAGYYTALGMFFVFSVILWGGSYIEDNPKMGWFLRGISSGFILALFTIFHFKDLE